MTNPKGNVAGKTVSIIICTKDRTEHFTDTMASLARVRVPRGWEVELIVMDNGGGASEECVRRQVFENMPVRFFIEPRPGKSYCLNRGLEISRSEILMFTDDDVRFPENWIEEMCAPIFAGEADAVRGTIVLSEALIRPWMTPALRERLAHTPGAQPDERTPLTGANMAISRAVFSRVPAFDTELGPSPRMNGGEDTLFSWQLREAGFRIVDNSSATVTHCFSPSRLTRKMFLQAARKGARGDAYLLHHWLHESYSQPVRKVIGAAVRLTRWRVLGWRELVKPDHVADWEINLAQDLYRKWDFLREMRRPRNYTKHGLVKLNGAENSANSRRSQLEPSSIHPSKIGTTAP